jgi:hypothetical protein
MPLEVTTVQYMALELTGDIFMLTKRKPNFIHSNFLQSLCYIHSLYSFTYLVLCLGCSIYTYYIKKTIKCTLLLLC